MQPDKKKQQTLLAKTPLRPYNNDFVEETLPTFLSQKWHPVFCII